MHVNEALPVECGTVGGGRISSRGPIAVAEALVAEEAPALLDLVRASGWAPGVSGGVRRVVLVKHNIHGFNK